MFLPQHCFNIYVYVLNEQYVVLKRSKVVGGRTGEQVRGDIDGASRVLRVSNEWSTC